MAYMDKISLKLSLLRDNLSSKAGRIGHDNKSCLVLIKRGAGAFWIFIALFIIYIVLLLVSRMGR